VNVIEISHQGQADFRIGKRVFATPKSIERPGI
jgi:hypothetical protein